MGVAMGLGGHQKTQNSDYSESGVLHVERFIAPQHGKGIPQELAECFEAAQVSMSSLSSVGPIRVRLTAFPNMFFFHVSGPQFEAEWVRDTMPGKRGILVIVNEGDVVVNDETVPPGRLAFVHPDDPGFRVQTGKGLNDFLCVTFGAHTFEGLAVPPVANSCNLSHLERSQLAPCVAFMLALCDPLNIDGVLGAPLAGIAHEMVRALVQMIVDEHADTSPTYARAVRLLETEYVVSGLNAVKVAAMIGISVRSLQTEFEERGETVASTLRLIRARAAKANRAAHPRAAAGEVARLSGFGSESSMRRAIRDYEALRAA